MPSCGGDAAGARLGCEGDKVREEGPCLSGL